MGLVECCRKKEVEKGGKEDLKESIAIWKASLVPVLLKEIIS